MSFKVLMIRYVFIIQCSERVQAMEMKRNRYRSSGAAAAKDFALDQRQTRVYLCEFCLKTFESGFELRKHKTVHMSKSVEAPPTGTMGNTLFLPSQVLERLEHLQSFRLLRTMLQNGFKSKLLSLLDSNRNLHDRIDTDTAINDKESVRATKPVRKKRTQQFGFTCGECGKKFAARVSLETHMNIHLGIRPYKCSTCGLRLSQKSGLTVHMRIHTGEKPFKCKICHRAFTQQVPRAHVAAHMGEKLYKCDLCPSIFGSASVLKTHKIAKHTQLRPYKCDICKKDFADVYYMRKHRAVHRTVRPYQCPKCDKSYITKSNLTRHLITHTEERPFVCSVCKRSYNSASSLFYHMTTHSDEKSFVCGVCGQELSTKQNLESHVNRHLNSKSLK